MTQTPPAQSKGHMRSRAEDTKAGLRPFPAPPGTRPAWPCASSPFALSSHALTKAKMGSHRHSYTPMQTVEASHGVLKPPAASQPIHLRKRALPTATPHGSSPRCCTPWGQAALPAPPSVTYHGGAAIEHRAADLGREVDAHVEAGGRELPAEGGVGHHPQGGAVGAGGAPGAAQSCTGRDPRLGPRAQASVTRGRGAPGDSTAPTSSTQPHQNHHSSEKNQIKPSPYPGHHPGQVPAHQAVRCVAMAEVLLLAVVHGSDFVEQNGPAGSVGVTQGPASLQPSPTALSEQSRARGCPWTLTDGVGAGGLGRGWPERDGRAGPGARHGRVTGW